ncbi:unnamed protein product [Enterobius vermicularis]|uniref:Secreted protein n=1 Tax=Enterobius vermicularis TaxID=51028 RepID=A0A0N4UU04_ENTVE|nr:unnamed protein product [Enterobius vermicularis]
MFDEEGVVRRTSRFVMRVLCALTALGISTRDIVLPVRRRSRGVVVSTQDFESCDGSSNLHGDLHCRYKKLTELQTVPETEDPTLKYAACKESELPASR